MSLPTQFSDIVDITQPSLYLSIATILFNPIFWNITARQEYRTHFLTKLAFNSPYYGCYSLAATIFLLGALRDHLYREALKQQPTLALLGGKEIQAFAMGVFGLGTLLVITSMWALGITGTYLGDYFDDRFLLEKRVESFPFNVTDNPMYYGSTLMFLGTALYYKSPLGLLLTILVFVEYKIALLYEEPFTAAIYALRDAARIRAKKNPHRSPVKSSQFSALSPRTVPVAKTTATARPSTPVRVRSVKSAGAAATPRSGSVDGGTPVRRSTRNSGNEEFIQLEE